MRIDCHDAYALASFWSQVLGQPVHEECRPGDPEALIEGAGVLFIAVPEGNEFRVERSAAERVV
ncbi:hypothetical protein IAG44_08350 [Streptomyces roseirectus]|uniref:Glyoxalase-like domain-containing protein n=1 Tax=Streptomyces roseirectus TaxID=2768066 RepID=A0A7H0IS87_9ACTN|nr:hypothetical protein IAG44_08350 [Streptomyces roseirectus]